jgi:tetratricopeptide (TPR) repeat protein
MVCRIIARGAMLIALGFAVGIAAAADPGAGGEDPRVVPQFLQGLRERGYYDLAADYLERVRTQPDAPADLVTAADYELGRLLLDEGSKTGDLVRRKDLLDRARIKLDAFTRANPDHPRAPDALMELARILVERGHLAVLQSDEAKTPAEKAGKLAEARGAFGQARSAYAEAETRQKAAYAKFPPFIPESETARRAEREAALNGLLQAQLQKAMVDYEEGKTYPGGSKEREALMGRALTQFEELYKAHRYQMAGLTAQMMQGKCFEERGELGAALGIYKKLLEHDDPRLKPLQRHVGYFQIVALGKRKEYALAADEARRWLQANPGIEAQRSPEGLGVQLELGRNILAQLPGIAKSDQPAAIKQATDFLGKVVRYASPHKAEALELLRKYRPVAAADAAELSRLSYEDAVAQAEEAIASQEWPRAAALFRQAVRKAETARDLDKLHYARYNLAFCLYMDGRYYESLVLADHLARRYPRVGLAPRAAELGMAALGEAYDTSKGGDRTADLDNLIDLARYTAETYPDAEQGDTARLTLGKIYRGTGRYAEAVEALEAVRPTSARRLDALGLLGATHWNHSLALRREGKTAEADAEASKAVASLQAALKGRRDAGATAGDPALIASACDLADVYLDSGKADEAVKLLEPLARDQTSPEGKPFARLMADLLRAHVATNRVDQALADMAALEKSGGGAGLTQMYYSLGRLLQKELDALKKRGDRAGLERTQQAYQKFLAALADSKSGQTFESLRWAGDGMLALGNAKQAEEVFRRALDAFDKDPAFRDQPNSAGRRLLTRLSLAAALRGQEKFDEAASLIESLAAENPRAVEPLMEKGMLLEDRAEAGKGDWAEAFKHWRGLALQLGRGRVKPVQYYEAWYHAALALYRDKKPKEARQTLAGIMRLSASVGGPEMKKKYQALLDQIK